MSSYFRRQEEVAEGSQESRVDLGRGIWYSSAAAAASMRLPPDHLLLALVSKALCNLEEIQGI